MEIRRRKNVGMKRDLQKKRKTHDSVAENGLFWGNGRRFGSE